MTAQKKREILTGGIAALLIVCAVAARVVTRGHREAPYFLPVSLLRSLIYIGLMTWWVVSLWQRIVQTQVRRYLAATAALCVFWLSIRTVKFFFAGSSAAIRYLWYGYYVPMLFIPLLCVLVALSLGKPENYRLPKWTDLLYLPTTLLLLLVLTNDLHHTQADAIYKPNTNIRRSEVAAILTRMMHANKRQSFALGETAEPNPAETKPEENTESLKFTQQPQSASAPKDGSTS